jgi:hypothetical protein
MAMQIVSGVPFEEAKGMMAKMAAAGQLGELDSTLLETALDYIEEDQLGVVKDYLAGLSDQGLYRILRNLYMLTPVLVDEVIHREASVPNDISQLIDKGE